MKNVVEFIGIYIVPVFVVGVVCFGIFRRVPVFDAFLVGAKSGMQTIRTLLPTLIGLLTAVQMLQASGVLELLTNWITPAAKWLGFPAEIIPLVLLRPISGSGSTAMLLELFRSNGPDSYAGLVASVVSGATDTTFYAITVYYGSVGIRKIGCTVLAALAADVTCILLAVFTTRLFYFS